MIHGIGLTFYSLHNEEYNTYHIRVYHFSNSFRLLQYRLVYFVIGIKYSTVIGLMIHLCTMLIAYLLTKSASILELFLFPNEYHYRIDDLIILHCMISYIPCALYGALVIQIVFFI